MFSTLQEEIVNGIEARIAAWTFLPEGTYTELVFTNLL
jgi:hypothetical protein